MTIRFVGTSRAPAAIGPYSQAVVSGGLVYCSGQIPLDAASGDLVSGDIAEETRVVLENLRAVLEEAGSSPQLVLKTTVYLRSMADFAEMNRAYAAFFEEHRPARAAVEVSGLPKGVRIEIDAVAALK